jgi:transcriptional regulator with XRE-family HTH domain
VTLQPPIGTAHVPNDIRTASSTVDPFAQPLFVTPAVPSAGEAADKSRSMDPRHPCDMPARETAIQRGARRSRYLLRRVGEELRVARMSIGMSARTLGRLVGISHSEVLRIERALAPHAPFETLAKMASVLGCELSLGIHAIGAPVRDKAHVALLTRFAARLGRLLRWRTEVPVTVPGDLRSADGMVEGTDFDAIVEAETRLDDLQAVERRLRAKQRDLGAKRAILLIGDTRHNRAVIAQVPDLNDRFPVGTRAALHALSRGGDPGGECLVVL